MSKLSKTYLSLTFLIMLLCWGLLLLCGLGGVTLHTHKWLYALWLLGGLSPTIASYFSLRRAGEVANVKEWLKNIFDFKHNVFSYLMVVILAALFILPQCLISGFESRWPLYAIFVMIPMMIVGGGLEEAGWRYVLQPELEKKFSFAVSTLIVSVIWWLWHLPLFYIQGVGQYGQDYLAFGISVLALSFALASIRKNTGSVWLCVLFHSMVNSLLGIYDVGQNMWGSIASAAILILGSCALVKINEKIKIFDQ